MMQKVYKKWNAGKSSVTCDQTHSQKRHGHSKKGAFTKKIYKTIREVLAEQYCGIIV